MSVNFEIGDALPPLKHTRQPCSCSATAPSRGTRTASTSTSPTHAKGPRRSRPALAPAGALALRCVTEGLGPTGRSRSSPTACASPSTRPPTGLHRPGDRGRGRQLDPRAHREKPLRRGRFRRHGVGQQDRGRRHDRGDRTGQRPIRVGNCSGFYGDRASAMADMARAGGIDVLTGDYLAEVTMLILGKARAKDPPRAAATFLQHLDAALEHLVANRIRLVVNAGGLNPGGLAAATRDLIARHGHDLRLPRRRRRRLRSPRRAATGRPSPGAPDERRAADVMAASATHRQRLPRRVRHRPSARNGADIVITGRVADASVVVGAACGGVGLPTTTPSPVPSAPGTSSNAGAGHRGNFSGFRSIDLTEPGFPIAEIAADGSSVITKNPGTGGAVTLTR